MEWAAACWNQWKEGDVSISFNPQKPGYLHDHFIGLNYEVNLSKPAGERIERVFNLKYPLEYTQRPEKIAANQQAFAEFYRSL